MRNRMYGGVRGRKTRVGEKLHRFPPTRFVFSTIIKILVLCTSLVPCLVLPRELRETTEGRPKELPANKKCVLLRWVSIKLFPFLKNRPPKKKIRFLFAYLQNKVLLLRRKLSKVKNKIE